LTRPAEYAMLARMSDSDLSPYEGGSANLAGSIKVVAQAMDEHGTSAWIASVGATLIAFALATQEGSWSHMTSGEFIATLVVGLVFVLAGVLYRFYTRIRADDALRAFAARELDDAGLAKQTAAEIVKTMADAAPKH
jgi:hypothetical protein